MRKLLKWLFILFVLPLVVLFLAVWAFFEFVPQAKIRAMAAQELSRKLNRQVEKKRTRRPNRRGIRPPRWNPEFSTARI